MKKFLLVSLLFSMLLTIFLLGFHVASFLSDLDLISEDVTVGQVSVIGRAYYEKNEELTELDYVYLGKDGNNQDDYKTGIYDINITDNSTDNFIENVRVYFNIYSKQNTYLRVKIHEQLTLTLTSYDPNNPDVPIKTELAINMDSPTDFNYIFNTNTQNQLDPEHLNWYDNRLIDGYIYYKLPIMRNTDMTPKRIGLIKDYYNDLSYITQPLGYSLQLGITVEAVQGYGGPIENWGLSNPPWGGSWE
jgi:hypothetical protein